MACLQATRLISKYSICFFRTWQNGQEAFEIKQTYVSNQTVEYIKPTIASDTSCDHANLSDGTHLIDSQCKKR